MLFRAAMRFLTITVVTAAKAPPRHVEIVRLRTGNLTASVGFIQSPDTYHHYVGCDPPCDLWATFSGPLGHVTLVNFNRWSAYQPIHIYGVILYKEGKSFSDEVFNSKAGEDHVTRIYHTHIIHLKYVCLKLHPVNFKVIYSFHEAGKRPYRVKSGLWNCSTPEWSDVALHFRCNLDTECEAGEDEVQCFYNGHCGQDYLTLNGRCYWYNPNKENTRLSWNRANLECKLRGGYLVSLNTPEEWQAVMTIFESRRRCKPIFTGMFQIPSAFPLM